jgi:hypothetical protein
MEFLGGLFGTIRGHDYINDMLDKMCVLMASNNTFTGEEATILFFERVWVTFWTPRSIIYDGDTRFLNVVWNLVWDNLDSKL